ncbi:hypothetical protein ACSNOK_26610 [Streptomyces sp. URMC 126]|uniref:hypothetical protein n=1 Tax=Streptomyces sp. URMC 126 TaxID=3423401 RepID=UPI003F1B3A66
MQADDGARKQDPQGERSGRRRDEGGAPRARPAPIGKGDTPNVAGSDVQQPEIAEGPVEGLQPGEEVRRGPWHPPVEVDPPPGYGRPPGERGGNARHGQRERQRLGREDTPGKSAPAKDAPGADTPERKETP